MGGLRVGLDLGGTKLGGVIVDSNDVILASVAVPSPSHGRWVVTTTVELIDELCTEIGVTRNEIDFVGMGIPGLIGNDGRIYGCPHVPGLHEIDLRVEIQAIANWQVELDNDVNCAALTALSYGPSFVLLTIGTGIGGALVTGSTIERGSRGFAGEPGHMIVVAGGDLCTCTKRGCLEVYASGRALAQHGEKEFARGRLSDLVDPENPYKTPSPAEILGACATNEACAEIVADFCFYLAVGISNLLEICDFEKVLIGGGVSGSFEHFAEKLAQQYLAVMPSSRLRQQVEIDKVEFGPLAGAIGASRLIRST